MKIERMFEIETNDIRVWDRIHVNHYTATCQKLTPNSAIFLFDQYLDKPMRMNRNNTNNGGYLESDLRKALQSDDALNIFSGIRDNMVPFDNGDLLRIPFAGEIFGDELPEWFEQDGKEQWEPMTDRRNRLASRCGDYEWGWINNKRKSSLTNFCIVCHDGLVSSYKASNVIGVRPVFQIANEIYKKKEIQE